MFPIEQAVDFMLYFNYINQNEPVSKWGVLKLAQKDYFS
jgi:hypothetical protein